MFYRRKPVKVEAFLWSGESDLKEPTWIVDEVKKGRVRISQARGPEFPEMFIDTINGAVRVDGGDYIVRNKDGAIYPRDPEYFESHYAELEMSEMEEKTCCELVEVELEAFARELHEAGRAAVEAGNTVAAEKFGEQTRKFMEWDEITEPAREGRRIQAAYLLDKFLITSKP